MDIITVRPMAQSPLLSGPASATRFVYAPAAGAAATSTLLCLELFDTPRDQRFAFFAAGVAVNTISLLARSCTPVHMSVKVSGGRHIAIVLAGRVAMTSGEK